MKKCKGCDTQIPSGRGSSTKCMNCAKVINQASKHGLTDDRFDEILDSQGGCCAICQTPLGRVDIDHDHNCCPGPYSCGECVRGFLCRTCNVGLGMFQDSIENLRAAVRYLEGN